MQKVEILLKMFEKCGFSEEKVTGGERINFGRRLAFGNSPEIAKFFEKNARCTCVCAIFVVPLHPILKEDRFGLLATSIKEC